MSTAGQTDSTGTPPQLPRHIAIIMDGNGRWARQRGLPRYAGHPAGVESVRKVVEHCVQQGIEVLTLFAFSSENWQRPKKEVGLIMDLFIRALRKEARRLHRNGVRLRVIGDRTAFPEKLQQRIHEVEALTAANSGLILQVAANYGGRWDIIRAARRLAWQAAAGEIDVDAIDEQALAAQLAFPDLPDPDLFIRTGGECRVSNFLLWQAAYSELYFTDLLWPEFDAAALDAAIADYSRRQRRFGRTGEQVVETQSAKDL
ncbi:isoprenyl transferase [endosymbiont of Ridgeia piscesae]|uniref:Ditrans,polycis-undecaprenyl-diphosphate synthase ((2E,6E)-farnesyl-diphosphate specific) n=1 Tax=endosymbiont of Ridgeia piscesae TaxID=54398 RepID=A0A0T5YV39_9GAMM|nr:isoprenyl transferase [endosymbiont of Ridgeia piscesae]KRT54457.1 Undecaprenyl pyrophosphate synthetase [endosymbiont of Ridgeia piscesae]KRT56734.1 Undecaprenyl pyrophosphate synthetase [endosymbiont of Ridgeia piscesae]